MKFNKQEFLTVPAALLMLMSTGFGGIANAARRPARHKARTAKVVKKSKRTNRKNNKKSKGKSIKVPWTKANHFATIRADKSSVWTYDKYVPDWMIRQRSRVFNHAGGHSTTAVNYALWSKFYRQNQSKRAFTNHAKTYSGYSRVNAASYNTAQEMAHRSWTLALPYGYTKHAGHHTSYDTWLNTELYANLPLHHYTAGMRSALHQVMIPAYNGQRILTSFGNLMRKSHGHPTFKMGNVKYILNRKSKVYEPVKGTDGYGRAYVFNTKKNRYVQTNAKQLAKKLQAQRAKVQKQTQKAVTNNQQHAAKNTKFSQKAQNTMKKALRPGVTGNDPVETPKGINPGQTNTGRAMSEFLNGPAAGYQALANDPDFSHADQATAAQLAQQYEQNAKDSSVPTAVQQQMPKTQKPITFQMTATDRTNVENLFLDGAFKGMSEDNAITLARYLVRNPAMMNAYLTTYANPQVHNSTDAAQLAAQANQLASDHSQSSIKANQNNLITNDQNLTTNANLLQNASQQLAKAEGIQK